MDALVLTWPAIAVHLLVAVLSLVVWRRYLSPLADIPGPFVASFSRWWHIRRILIGDQNLQLVQLHDKYGTSLSPPLYLPGLIHYRRPLHPHCPQ
jgi:hypothetical protein